jgi:hypothetical protein
MRVEFRIGDQVAHRTKRLQGDLSYVVRLLAKLDEATTFWLRVYADDFYVSMCRNPTQEVLYVERRSNDELESTFFDYRIDDLKSAKADYLRLVERAELTGKSSRTGLPVFSGGPGVSINRGLFERIYDYFYQRTAP